MQHSIPHGLDLPLARRAIRRALDSYVERFAQYRPHLSWHGDDRAVITFSAMGATVRGSFELNERALALTMDVPLLLRPFRARAIEVVEREVREWVERARQGGLDAHGS